MDTLSESTQDLTEDQLEVMMAVMEVFIITEDEFMVLIGFDPRQWAGEIDRLKKEEGALQAKSLGFPHDPECHQQPYSLHYMFPLSLSPDRYETIEEFEFVVWLFKVWNIKVREIAGNSENIKATMRRIKTMSVWLAYRFGDDNQVSRAIDLKETIEWINYFRYTHGCFDLESGALIDRETPVIRELKDKWGLE